MPIDIILSVGSEAEKEELEVGELVRRKLVPGSGERGRGRVEEDECTWGRSEMRSGEGVGEWNKNRRPTTQIDMSNLHNYAA